MKRRRGPKAAHVVGGILAFLLLATMAACGGASVPTTAPPQPAPPSAPPPALPTQPVLPMAPPGTGPVQASPTVPPIQTTTATPAPSPSVEPQPRPTLPTTQPSPVLPAATPTTATRTPFPPPPPPPWPLITLPPGTPGVMVVEPNPESVLGILPASWASVFFAQLGSGPERARFEDIFGLDVGPLYEDVVKALGPQWAQFSEVTSVAFSDHRPEWSEAGIFTGDFGALEDILREASSTDAATVHTYRGIEFFTIAIPRYLREDSYDLHFAVLDSSMLVVAEGYEGSGLALIEEVLDRRIDEAELNE